MQALSSPEWKTQIKPAYMETKSAQELKAQNRIRRPTMESSIDDQEPPLECVLQCLFYVAR